MTTATTTDTLKLIPLTFAIHRSETEIVRVTHTRSMIKIGGDHKSHLTFPGLGRCHAVIETVDSNFIELIDMGHEIGSIVNGKKVGKVQIKLGDTIQFGDTKLILEQIGDQVYTPTTTTEVTPGNFPAWFRPETGFHFLDVDGDLVIVLGPGNYIDVECAGILNLKEDRPRTLYQTNLANAKLAAAVFCKAKNHWFIWDLSVESEAYWTGSKPL